MPPWLPAVFIGGCTGLIGFTWLAAFGLAGLVFAALGLAVLGLAAVFVMLPALNLLGA
jgi:hypothetical protein